MPREPRELRTDLRRAEFAIDHQAGSHQVWKHPLLPGISANLAGKDSADAKPYEDQVRAALQVLRGAKGNKQS